MPYIYTISHPITNDVVYVGVCNVFKTRVSSHINSTPKHDIGKWILSLRDSFLLPKIEVIDICDREDLFELERYWIHQLTVWGFSLINKNKVIKPKKTYFKKSTKLKPLEIVKPGNRRKSRVWNSESFAIGLQYAIEKSKGGFFVILFHDYKRRLNIGERFLHRAECDGIYYYTVLDEKPKYNVTMALCGTGYFSAKKLGLFVPKPRPVKPKKAFFGFKNVFDGYEISMPLKRWDSFRNSFQDYRNKNSEIFKFEYNYKFNEDRTEIIITFVTKGKKVISKLNWEGLERRGKIVVHNYRKPASANPR
jgi:hypothetical protein